MGFLLFKFEVCWSLLNRILTVVEPMPKAQMSVMEVTKMDIPACLRVRPMRWCIGNNFSLCVSWS